MRKVADSTLLIVNGAGFESFLGKLLASAGGQRQVVEAAAGLTSRAAREGEEAVMSDADLADAMCSAASEERPQAAASGAEQSQAAPLPAEMGLFEVTLAQRPTAATPVIWRTPLTRRATSRSPPAQARSPW